MWAGKFKDGDRVAVLLFFTFNCPIYPLIRSNNHIKWTENNLIYLFGHMGFLIPGAAFNSKVSQTCFFSQNNHKWDFEQKVAMPLSAC